MAGYHDRLVANLRAWVDVLDTLDDGGRPSVRIAVVDGSGHVANPVLTDLRLPWFWCPEPTCHYPEYDGDLHDVLAAEGDVGAADWSDAFRQFDVFKTTLGLPCLPAGITADQCAAADPDGTPIPPCETIAPDRPDPRTPLPCFRLAPAPPGEDPQTCARYGIVARSRVGPRALLPAATLRCGCGA